MEEQAPAEASFKQMLQIQGILVEAVSSASISSERAEEIIESEDSIRRIVAAILIGQRQTIQSRKAKEEVKALLFIAPFGDDGKPLFRTQRQMAESVAGHTDSPFYGKTTENIRIFINQILKGRNESRARPLSKKMEIALPLVISSRIADADKASEVSRIIIKAIKEL